MQAVASAGRQLRSSSGTGVASAFAECARPEPAILALQTERRIRFDPFDKSERRFCSPGSQGGGRE